MVTTAYVSSFPTLSDAIGSVNPGTHLVQDRSETSAAITVTKRLWYDIEPGRVVTFTGQFNWHPGSDGSRISGGAALPGQESGVISGPTVQQPFNIQGVSDIVVDGLTIDGFDYVGLSVGPAERILIDRCHFKNGTTGGVGVQFKYSPWSNPVNGHNSVHYAEVTGCRFSITGNNEWRGVATNTNLETGPTKDIRYLRVVGNRFEFESTGFGVELFGYTDAAVIDGNTFVGPAHMAVSAAQCRRAVVTNNSIEGTRLMGIEVANCEDSAFVHNTIRLADPVDGTYPSHISLNDAGGRNVVSGNTLVNVLKGIHLYGSAPDIHSAVITGNQIHLHNGSITSGGGPIYPTGIWLQSNPNYSPKRFVINNNMIQGKSTPDTRYGIVLDKASHGAVLGNYLDTLSHGIYKIAPVTNVEVAHNVTSNVINP